MKTHRLIQSYYLDKYLISTVFRRASVPGEIWYYETIVWEWDKDTKERGKILLTEDSGSGKVMAMNNHFDIIKTLHED